MQTVSQGRIYLRDGSISGTGLSQGRIYLRDGSISGTDLSQGRVYLRDGSTSGTGLSQGRIYLRDGSISGTDLSQTSGGAATVINMLLIVLCYLTQSWNTDIGPTSLSARCSSNTHSLTQERIYSDKCRCCHTEKDVGECTLLSHPVTKLTPG